LNNLTNQIKANYESVRESILSTAIKTGRRPESIRLVVVTKTHPLESVLAAVDAGVRDFGENYAEEAAEKIGTIGQSDITWHMIGHIQSRKADLVAKSFDIIHSVDSVKLASRLDRFCGKYGRRLPFLLECNVSGEESKFGFAVADRSKWPALSEEVNKIVQMPNLQLQGLMTMPPFFNSPEQSRPFFRSLRSLRDYLEVQFPSCDWRELSMGTSVDYSTAIEEGATIVRIGTAILGSRPPKN
jgi:hypothetical protein